MGRARHSPDSYRDDGGSIFLTKKTGDVRVLLSRGKDMDFSIFLVAMIVASLGLGKHFVFRGAEKMDRFKKNTGRTVTEREEVHEAEGLLLAGGILIFLAFNAAMFIL